MKWNTLIIARKRLIVILVFVFYMSLDSTSVLKAIDVSDEAGLQQALLTRSSSDVINILSDITLTGSLSQLDRTLTINDNAHHLAGNSTFRLFDPISSGMITLTDTTFENGNAKNSVNEDGGVFLFTDGDITFLNSMTFTNNVGNYGGAIANRGATVQFDGFGDVLFESNEADSNNGGGVYNTGLLTFRHTGNLMFQNNSAYNGGAVYNYKQTIDQMVIFENTGNIVFSNNTTTSKGRGGAIFNEEQMEFRNVGDIIFSGNTADFQGGAVYSQSDSLTFNNLGNVLFQNNSIMTYYPTCGGGAIAVYDGNVELAPQNGYTITFEGNSSLAGTSTVIPNAIHLQAGSTLLLNPEQNANILFYDPISSDGNTARSFVTQNAPGTTKIWGNNTGYVGDTEILQGAFKLMGPDSDNHAWLTDPAVFGTTTSGAFTLANAATLGLWVHATDTTSHATLQADTMTMFDGAKLYVTGISLVPQSSGEIVYENVIQTASGSIARAPVLIIPTSMQNTNSLTHFELVNNVGNVLNADLKITYLKNISDVIGQEYVSWDNIRLDPDTPADLRTFLDNMYNAPNDDLLRSLVKATQGNSTVDSNNAHRQSGIIFNGVMVSRIHGIGFEDHLGGFANSEGDGYEDMNGYPSCYAKKRSCPQSSELWGMFSQNWTRLNPSAQSNGYKYAPYSFTIGKERAVNRFLYGIAGQYYHGHVKSFGQDFTQTEIQGATLGLYGVYRGHRNYLLATMQCGVGWNDEASSINNVVLDASYHSAMLGTSLEFGRRVDFGKWNLTPHVGVDYTFYHAEAFDENGPPAIARSFGSVNFNVVEVPFGLRLTQGFHFRKYGIVWTPMLDVAYVRSVAENVPTTTANFAATPNSRWTVTGSDIGRDAFRTTVGSRSRLPGGWDLGLSYDLETRNRYTSHQLNAMIAWRR